VVSAQRCYLILGFHSSVLCVTARVRVIHGAEAQIVCYAVQGHIDSFRSLAINQHSCERECNCSAIVASNRFKKFIE
jgi:hypothetical protein